MTASLHIHPEQLSRGGNRMACPAKARNGRKHHLAGMLLFMMAALPGLPLIAREQEVPPAGAVIRSRVQLVPVDILVTDKQGNPVEGLTAEDFQIFENGKFKEIQYFGSEIITAAEPPGQPTAAAGASVSKPFSIRGGNIRDRRRTFIVFMGRMGNQDPFKCLDDLEAFLRTKLLPQDQLAFMAYNRMTPFTSDPQKILEVFLRYKENYREIETIMQVKTKDLLGIVKNDYPLEVQRLINGIFQGTGVQHNRPLAGIPFPSRASSPDMSVTESEICGKALMDLQNLHRAIGILDHMDGVKHLMYFSSDGLFLKRQDTEHDLARAANSARVAIHTFQTGGMDNGYTRRGVYTLTAVGSIRNVSDLSGGLCFVHTTISDGLEKMDRLSRTYYTIGFQPGATGGKDGFQKIAVKTKRSDLVMYYRRQYRR